MTTQVQMRGAAEATQEARTLASRELDMNTTDWRINLHDGTTAGGIPHANCFDIQNQEWSYAAATGTDAIAITLSKAPAAYLNGQKFSFKAASNNTGSATLNVNSLGAKTIKKNAGGALVVLKADDIIQGGIYEVAYDGTDMLLLGGGAGGASLIASATASADASVDFIGVFTAGNNYRIQITGFIPASNGSALNMRFHNGSSFITSGYALVAREYLEDGTIATRNTASGTVIQIRRNCQDVGNVEILIFNPVVSAKTFSVFRASGTNNVGAIYQYDQGGGSYESATSITGVQFSMSSGNLTDGTFDIFEEVITG